MATRAEKSEAEFTNVCLEENQAHKNKRLVLKDPKDPEFLNKKGKAPRRTLYFSDGTLEEYSESEDENDEVDNTPKVDPKSLKWLPWIWYYLGMIGSRSLGVADVCGEKIAWMLGITSPKYQYAIDEYHRLKKEEEEEKAREERELQIHKERRMQSNNPDVEAIDSDSISNIAYSNKAYVVHDTDNGTELVDLHKYKMQQKDKSQDNNEPTKESTPEKY